MSIASIVLAILTGLVAAILQLSIGAATLMAVAAYLTVGMSAMVMALWWGYLQHSQKTEEYLPTF